MSARVATKNRVWQKGYRWRSRLALLVFCAWFGLAQGQEPPAPLEMPPSFIEDPLLTVPPEVFIGKSLPGDAGVIRCPTTYEASKNLNLELAIDLALCRNPKIKSAWAAIKIQAAALGEARAAYFPVLNGSISRLNDQTNYPNPSDRLLSDPQKPGGDFYVHGSSVTLGCVPVTDAPIEEL